MKHTILFVSLLASTFLAAQKDTTITIKVQLSCAPCKCKGDTVTAPPVNPPTPPVTGRSEWDRIGTNCFTWTPVQYLDTFATVRAYLSSFFLSNERGLFVEPLWQARIDGNVEQGLDTWIEKVNAKGITPVLCVNQTWPHYGHANADHAPIKKGADPAKMSSYSEFAGLMGNLAMRYGKVKHPDVKLRVDPQTRWGYQRQSKKSGLGYKFVLEVWNEPDKWWNKEVYMEPEHYAAMLAVCYDSIQAADPAVKVAMAGLTNFDLDYLNRMDTWFKANRGGEWPCDVINVHHYSNLGNQLGKHPPTWHTNKACTVAEDKDFQRAALVVEFARARGLEAWCSEFGYDTKAPSQCYPHNDGGNPEKTQGEWNVQAIEAYLKAGFDAVYLFTANDEPGAENGGTFNSSGFLRREAEGFVPKQSYKILCEYLARAKGMKYGALETQKGIDASVSGKGAAIEKTRKRKAIFRKN